MAATKRTPTPGDADKLIAHQARLLKAPRIAEHYHRLAEQGVDHVHFYTMNRAGLSLSTCRLLGIKPETRA